MPSISSRRTITTQLANRTKMVDRKGATHLYTYENA
jgi:hypothetical protein